LGKPADKASATALELIKAGCSPEHLDEAVQQAASELASAANNDGLEAQVKFLLAAGDWKPEDILFKAKEAKEEG
jgi:hypothetical protein